MKNHRKELDPEILKGLTEEELNIVKFFQYIMSDKSIKGTRSLNEDMGTLKYLLNLLRKPKTKPILKVKNENS